MNWKDEQLLDPDDWQSRYHEMPEYCRRIVDGETIIHGGERVSAIIGRNEGLGWFVVGWDAVDTEKRVIWSEKWTVIDYSRDEPNKPEDPYSCDECEFKDDCRNAHGEEYPAVIGTHLCKKSWVSGTVCSQMKNNAKHRTYTVGEWRRDELKAYRADIFVAGDLDTCTRVCREECFRKGLCVTVEPCNYVYTGGAERGVRVGLIQYPPFPNSEDDIFERAVNLGKKLAEANCQWSYTVCATDRHVFCSRRRS